MNKEEDVDAFMDYLKKSTHARPRFTVTRNEFEAILEIDYKGSVMSVPLAEVLAFSRKKEAEIKVDQAAMAKAGRLPVYPYPVMAMDINEYKSGDKLSRD